MRANVSAADGKQRDPWFLGSLASKQKQAHLTSVGLLLPSYGPSLAVVLITLSTATFAWWASRRSADLVDDSGWVLFAGLVVAALVTLLVVHSDRTRAELARQAASAAGRIEEVEAKSRVEREGLEAALRD